MSLNFATLLISVFAYVGLAKLVDLWTQRAPATWCNREWSKLCGYVKVLIELKLKRPFFLNKLLQCTLKRLVKVMWEIYLHRTYTFFSVCFSSLSRPAAEFNYRFNIISRETFKLALWCPLLSHHRFSHFYSGRIFFARETAEDTTKSTTDSFELNETTEAAGTEKTQHDVAIAQGKSERDRRKKN